MRLAARAAGLAVARRSRHDAGGIDDVDVELSTSTQWRQYVGELASEAQASIEVVRSGAAWSPTRRYLERRFLINGAIPTDKLEADHMLLANPGYVRMKQLTSCPLCSVPWASLGHVVKACPALDGVRLRLSSRPISWWSSIPEVTAKSLWATPRCSSACDLAAIDHLLLVADPFPLRNGVWTHGRR